MNLVLCDDEQIFLNALQQKIMHWAEQTGHDGGIMLRAFTSSEDLLEAWMHGMAVDALFLDIEIPGEMSGLAVAQAIHNRNPYMPMVFITNYSEYAQEGYKVNALRYLHKPVSAQALGECLDILWHRWSLRNVDGIVLDLPGQILRFPEDAILYIEASGHYCTFKTTDSRQAYQCKLSLEALGKKLPPHLYVQCRRNYIVNIRYIRNIKGGNLTMANGEIIPMGRNYQAQLIRKFRQYYLGGTEEC